MVMTVASTAGLIFSQSRSAWAATVLILSPVLIWKWYRSNRLRIKTRTLIVVLSAAAAGLTLFSNIIERRLLTGGETYTQILTGDIDIQTQTGDDNVDSLYERLLIYRLFWEKWRARPWTGYGPGTPEILIATSAGEYARIARYNHFHNLGFDILIQFGAVGLLFYGALGWLIIRALWQGRRDGSIPFDYFLFVLSALALVLASCLTGQAMRDYKGVYLVGFLGGMAYSSKFAGSD
jgi:O-antigen ligase